MGRRLMFVEVAMIASENILQRKRDFTVYTLDIPTEPD
jgi:hypothetical protein